MQRFTRCFLCSVGPGRHLQRPFSNDNFSKETALSQRVSRRTRHFWESTQNQRDFLDGVARKLCLRDAANDFTAWKAVTHDKLRAMGGGALLGKYGASMSKMLSALYPSMSGFEGHRSRTRLPNGYWKVRENRRLFFDEIAALHSIDKVEDWRKIVTEDIQKGGGSAMLKLYRNSLFAALVDTYPEKEWEEANVRPQVPRGYWGKIENRRAFLEKFKSEWKGCSDGRTKTGSDSLSPEAAFWRQVETKDIHNTAGGYSFMKYYGNSLVRALRDLFPTENWKEDEVRSRMPHHYWKKANNVRRFLDKVAASKGVTQPSDWRFVTNSDIVDMGGFALFDHYGTVFNALQVAYPGASLHIDECRPSVPRAHWKDDMAVKAFIFRVAEKLHIREKADWARISFDQLRAEGGGGLLASMTLTDALKIAYPNDGPWHFASQRETSRHPRSNQRALAVAVATLLGDARPTLATA